MTEQQFKIKATQNVKQIINYISNKEYSDLLTVTTIHSSWYDEGETPTDGIKSFKEWLEEQLEMWSEDEGIEFVIDDFDEEQLDIMHFEGSRGFATYTPQSNGEEIDFWLEIDFSIDENDNITSVFNINF